MILTPLWERSLPKCKPRASGDDPDLLEVIMGMDE